MTYFAFLGLFLVIPLAGLLVLLRSLRRKGAALPARLAALAPGTVIAITALAAVLYTTAWDNYLVATGVWSYDPELVAGVILGFVPLEEYLFFVLQTLLTGWFFVALASRRRAQLDPAPATPWLCLWISLPVILIWLGSIVALAAGWQAARYAALLLVWALPPVLVQLVFGADILWQERRLVLPAWLLATLYYTLADVIAVRSGTWGFSPHYTLGVHLGPLPIEEVLFFLVTNSLIVFSVTLIISARSLPRFHGLVRRARRMLGGETAG